MAKELFDCCERRIDRLLILIFDTDGGSVFIWTETEYSCVFKICKRIRRKCVKRLVRHIYENISIFVPITCDTAGRDRDDCYVLPACVYTETTKPLQAHDNIFLFPKADKNWYADASSPTKATLPCPHTISVVWICFLLVFHSAQCAPDRCVLVVLCEHAYFPYAFGENEKSKSCVVLVVHTDGHPIHWQRNAKHSLTISYTHALHSLPTISLRALTLAF